LSIYTDKVGPIHTRNLSVSQHRHSAPYIDDGK